MRKALDSLSPRSRYRRFMHQKATFSDAEVRELTEVDGFDHLAICALVESPGAPPQIVGTARYYRLGDAEGRAEPGIVVLDAYQGRGLGKALFERLVRAASERGIRSFECEILSNNVPMKRLLRRVDEEAAEFVQYEAGCLTARVPLPVSTSDRRLRTPIRPALGSQAGTRAA